MTKPWRVLVVDDDADIRALLRDILRQEGYEVSEATDGADAVLALRASAYDVVLLDKNMPGPSGLDLLPGFRRVWPQCRFIMMTAFGDIASYVDAMEKGAVEFVFKPFRLEEMTTAVAKAVAATC